MSGPASKLLPSLHLARLADTARPCCTGGVTPPRICRLLFTHPTARKRSAADRVGRHRAFATAFPIYFDAAVSWRDVRPQNFSAVVCDLY